MSKHDFDYTKLLRDNLYDQATVNSYSGRAMYGKQCLSLSGSFSEVSRTLAYALNELHNTIVQTELDQFDIHEDSDPIKGLPNFERICVNLLDYRQDQLGLGTVVYWPDIEYNDPNDGEEDDEEYDEGMSSNG